MKNSLTRYVLAGLMAAIGICVAGTASAAAAECSGTESGPVTLCSEGHILTGTFAITGEQNPGWAQKFFQEAVTTPLEIGCQAPKITNGSFVGSSKSLSLSGLALEYKECKVIGSTNGLAESCQLGNPTVLVDGGEGTGAGPGLGANVTSTSELTLLGGGTGEKWTQYSIKSKPGKTCLDSYVNLKISGAATCKLPNSTTEAVTHILECVQRSLTASTGRQVTWSSNHIEVKLASGKAWSLKKS